MEKATLSINKMALRVLEEMLAKSAILEIANYKLENGTTIIDAGVKVRGSWAAGKYVSEICLGGLGKVDIVPWSQGELWLPGVVVNVNKPAVSCLASQYAGWQVSKGDYFAMGSGPARALALKEEIFSDLDYQDPEKSGAIMVMESRQIPNEEIADYIATSCNVDPDKLYLIVAPTDSLVGVVQISARIVETGMHKLHELGFDIKKIETGFGTSPISPLTGDDLKSLGSTNDCILYGGTVYFTVNSTDSELEKLINVIPSSASQDYGKPFLQLFQEYEQDFYKIDPMLFSPAVVIINNRANGKVFRAGHLNENILKKSLVG